MKIPNCQRWTEGRESYRPAGEPINPRPYGVAVIRRDHVAREFVQRHHYSGSYPAARVRIGLFRRAELVGVAVFSVGMQPAAMRKWAGVEPHQGVELGRFVLVDDVPANGETWFLARAFKLLQAEKPDLRAVLSYSDPVRRVSALGEVVLPGHVGTIYQAFNGRYVGRSKAKSLLLDADGRCVSRRTLSKIRNDEKGAAYAYESFRKAGAPARRPFESGPDYIARASLEGPFRKVRHPGNHAYVWAIGAQRRRTAREFPPSLQFPKQIEASP